jgi:hypothetical protein
MGVSLVPRTDDTDVYLVLDELRTGRVWREIDEGLANEAAVARKLLDMSRQGRVLGAAACDFVVRTTGEAVTAIV